MKRNYTIVKKENSTEVEGAIKISRQNDKKRRNFIVLRILIPVMFLLFYPFANKAQSTVSKTVEGCGSRTSFLLAGDSLMIAYQLLTGATNYSLSVRKSTGGAWIQPKGDVASGCSRIGYFVIYLRERPNECQSLLLSPGAYIFRITAFNDLIEESCVMDGNFYLTAEQVWKTTYSTWDVYNPRTVTIIDK